MMTFRKVLCSALAGVVASSALALAAAPALAQAEYSYDVSPSGENTETVSNAAFFETINVGGRSMAAANIFYDERCVDPEFCFKSDEMLISLVVFTNQGLREIVIALGETVDVPGGQLIFTSAGTAPSNQGAIELERYGLEFVFIADDPSAQ